MRTTLLVCSAAATAAWEWFIIMLFDTIKLAKTLLVPLNHTKHCKTVTITVAVAVSVTVCRFLKSAGTRFQYPH